MGLAGLETRGLSSAIIEMVWIFAGSNSPYQNVPRQKFWCFRDQLSLRSVARQAQ
jgi:hypothetical protein